jgi:DNA-binding beta-propeller fold protein YncE
VSSAWGKRAVLASGFALIAIALLATTASAAITPLASYGTGPGGGPGSIDAPLDVAIDPNTADVYVADGNNNRIDVFAADGTFLRAFGKDVVPGGGTGPEVCTTSCQAGSTGGGPGEFQAIEGVEVSAAGLVFVADYGAVRIAVFDTAGQFVRAFGKDVVPGGGTGFEICTTSCQAGTSGGGPGELDDPWAMTIGPDDNVYLADTDNKRIDVFAQSGEFVRAFGADVVPGGSAGFEVCTTSCQVGLEDGSAGSLSAPEGLDFDPAGNLWIAEYGGDRISVVAAQGQPAFLRAFGKDVVPGGGTGFEVCTTSCQLGDADAGAGALALPQGVAVDALGTAYVADSANNRVSTFNAAPAFVNAFGADVIPGGGTGFEICTNSCKSGAPSDAPGAFDEPYEPADDCRGAVYITDVNNNRIQRFGEPGTPLGPCAFALGTAKRNKRKGTATLTVEVPAPGTVALAGKGLKRASVEHAGFPGSETLRVKAKGKTKRKLRERGKRKVRPTITFTPSAFGAEAESAKAKINLKRKRKPKR